MLCVDSMADQLETSIEANMIKTRPGVMIQNEKETISEKRHCSTIDMHNSRKASNLNVRKLGYLLHSFRHKIRKGKTGHDSEPKETQKPKNNCTMPLLFFFRHARQKPPFKVINAETTLYSMSP